MVWAHDENGRGENAKKVFFQEIPGKRPRGRPRKRWADAIRDYIVKRVEKLEEVLREGQEWWRDRQSWTYLIRYSTQEDTGNEK